MANLIIKPSAGGDLVIKGSDDSPAITVGTTGTTTFAENATLSGTTTLANANITAGTFPAGHVVRMFYDKDSVPYTASVTGDQWYNSNLSITLTPLSINSKFVIQGQWSQRGTSNAGLLAIERVGATEHATDSTLVGDTTGNRKRGTMTYSYEGFDGNQRNQIHYIVYDDPDTDSELTYRLKYQEESTTTYINRNQNYGDNASNYAAIDISTMVIFEIAS